MLRWRVVIRAEGNVSVEHTTVVEAGTLDEAFQMALDWWEDQAPGLLETDRVPGMWEVAAIELWRQQEALFPSGFTWPPPRPAT